MHIPGSTVIGRLSGLLVISLGLVSPAFAQNPIQPQISAVRQACPADYQTYCSNVPTGGSASLACLKRNVQRLSEPCRQAVAAIGSPVPAAQNPRPAAGPSVPATTAPGAAAPAAPAGRTYGPPMSPRQEAMLLRRACGMDYRTYCSEVPIGGGRVIECLRENGPSLSRQCRSALLSARQGR
jgi:Cysteine rich repeat